LSVGFTDDDANELHVSWDASRAVFVFEIISASPGGVGLRQSRHGGVPRVDRLRPTLRLPARGGEGVKQVRVTDHYGFQYAAGTDDDGRFVVLSIIYEDEQFPEHHRIYFRRENFIRLVTDVAQNAELSADERQEIIRAASGGYVVPADNGMRENREGP
jgi:hypothetical protein